MPPKNRASISRSAAGLPRYYMDCGWYRHPNFAGLGLDSLALFEAMVGYACEHATDGRLPLHHEDLAAALGLRASAVRKALGPLIDRGRVTAEADHHQVVGYSSHNPTADEIDAFIEERSTSGAKGNHIRHHVNKGRWSADCEFCPPADPRSSDPNSDRSSDPIAVADPSHGLGWVGNPPQSPIPRATGDPTRPAEAGASTNPEEDQPPNPERTAALAIDHMARCDLRQAQATGAPIRQPNRWLAKAADTRRAAHHAELVAAATERPGADPVTLAEEIDPACGPDDGGLARAKAEAALSAQAAADLERQRATNAAWRAHADQILAGLTDDQRAELEAEARTRTGLDNDVLIRQAMRQLAHDRAEAAAS